MQIILQEDVEKLGTRGQVVHVAEGYARNYLLPRKLAIEASPANLKRLEKIRATLAKRTANEKESAEKLAELLAPVRVKLARKAGENDQLFGSVTAADIAEALAAQGYNVEKRKIQLAEPIKLIGEYQVSAKLHHDVIASIQVVVEREA
ncbi:MAG TPA: 50S ribosomal protein L9 [Candidatus Acidoferrales bacterium]|nr:50S ribosomal protein L9 [Candidatus Acidoferrales bacterium]